MFRGAALCNGRGLESGKIFSPVEREGFVGFVCGSGAAGCRRGWEGNGDRCEEAGSRYGMQAIGCCTKGL